jgi:hypothetical protein
MIASIFIIGISMVLFVYWLRYSCLILLRTSQVRDEIGAVADERFSVSTLLERLKTEGDLGPLERALDRDYHVVTYLMEHASVLELASLENKLLVLDYQLMRVWSHVTRSVAPQQSRKALMEMATVLCVLVGQMADHNEQQVEA